MISYQDIEGFRDACGSSKVANEIASQCSYKMLGRFESEQSVRWASGLCGQYETTEWFRSEHSRVLTTSRSLSEQRVLKDIILPAEFYAIPMPNKSRGVTAAFISPDYVRMEVVAGAELEDVVVSETEECKHGFKPRRAVDQWLKPWTNRDRKKLLLETANPR